MNSTIFSNNKKLDQFQISLRIKEEHPNFKNNIPLTKKEYNIKILIIKRMKKLEIIK